MKIFMHWLRFVLGTFFVFSGLVKAIDPTGTGIKMQEYFEVFTEYMPALSGLFHTMAEASLAFSILMIVLELILGISLLLGTFWIPTIWLYIAIILFFTFLTGFTLTTNKVTDCGCFGDFMKLKPIQTFSKDVLLTVLVFVFWFFRKKITPLRNNEYWWVALLGMFSFGVAAWLTNKYGTGAKINIMILGALTTAFYLSSYYFNLSKSTRYTMLGILSVLSIWFTMRNVWNVPIVDFRAYKNGTDLRKCTSSEGLDEGLIINKFVMESPNGEKKTVQIKEYSALVAQGWKQVGREDDVIREPQLPPCKDFIVTNAVGEEIQAQLLEDSGIQLWVTSYNTDKANREGFNQMNPLLKEAAAQGVKVSGLTGSDIAQANVLTEGIYSFNNLDATPIKTMNRPNPGLILISNGVVVKKWHYNHLPASYEAMKKEVGWSK
ncbi:MAG: hypothetical protein IPL35_02750 [Sphingobacteriales bacterium]|nr:hypothetical protein [Sphingobacteriales bacterium]